MGEKQEQLHFSLTAAFHMHFPVNFFKTEHRIELIIGLHSKEVNRKQERAIQRWESNNKSIPVSPFVNFRNHFPSAGYYPVTTLREVEIDRRPGTRTRRSRPTSRSQAFLSFF